VGSGLPTSGSQTVSAALNGSDGASTSSFYLLDLDATVPGVDVLYTASSAAGEGVHKYVLTTGGWVSRGFVGLLGIDHVLAEAQPDGSAVVYASNVNGVVRFVDSAPLSSTLSGTASTYLITAPSGFTFGGMEFAPGTSCYANCDGSSANPVLNANDFQCFLNKFAQQDAYANCDGSSVAPILNANDFQCFLNKFAAGCS
jgi:hypothetical protein